METVILKVIENAEYGIAVYVAKINLGFSVVLKDTDADEFLEEGRVFDTPEKAIAYAENLAKQEAPCNLN